MCTVGAIQEGERKDADVQGELEFCRNAARESDGHHASCGSHGKEYRIDEGAAMFSHVYVNVSHSETVAMMAVSTCGSTAYVCADIDVIISTSKTGDGDACSSE